MLSTSLLCVTALLSGVIADSSYECDSCCSSDYTTCSSTEASSYQVESNEEDCTGSIHKLPVPYQEEVRRAYNYATYTVGRNYNIQDAKKREDIAKMQSDNDRIHVHNEPGSDLTYVTFHGYEVNLDKARLFVIWSKSDEERERLGLTEPVIFNVSFTDKNGNPADEQKIRIAGSDGSLVFKFISDYDISGMTARITFMGRASAVHLQDDPNPPQGSTQRHKIMRVMSDVFATRPYTNFWPGMVCTVEPPISSFSSERIAKFSITSAYNDVKYKFALIEPIFFASIRRLARKFSCLSTEDCEVAANSLIHEINLDCGRELCDMFALACEPIIKADCFCNASPFDVIRSGYSFSAAFLKLCAMCAPEDRSLVAQSLYRAAESCSNPFMGFMAVVHVLNAYFNVSVPARATYEVIRQIETIFSTVPGVIGSYCLSKPEDATWFCGLPENDCNAICAVVKTPQWYPTRAWVGSSSVVISDASVVVDDKEIDAFVKITDDDDESEESKKGKAKKEQEAKKGFRKYFSTKVVVIVAAVVVVSVVGVFALM